MALKARITAGEFGKLAEAIRTEYKPTEDGEAYILDVTPVEGYALEDIGGLRSTLGKLKEQARVQKQALDAFTVDGEPIDPQAAAAALRQLKELGTLDPKKLADEKVALALKQQQDQHNKLLQAEADKAGKLTGYLRTVMVDQAATAALAAKGGNVKLLLPHVRAQLRVDQDGDAFKVTVLDADGKTPRLHVAKGQTADMTIDQLVEEMAASQDFAGAFASQSKPGGGTKPGAGGGTTPRVISAAEAASGQYIDALAKGEVTVA